MAGLYLFVLGISFAAITIIYFTLDSKQRALLLSRFGLDRQHRLPWALSTSPSPTKQPSEKSTLPTDQQHKDTFPPCRRAALADLTDPRFSVGGKSGKGLSELPRNTDKSLPHDVNVLAPQYKKHFTPTGFTVEEIKALGNFPDYAVLSGVPLPAAHTDFDIKTALARPYRPFRWPYHQTMSYKKLEPDYWLELDKDYATRIKQRQDLFVTHGTSVLDSLLGTELATKELLEMVLQFLCSRYPAHFTLNPRTLIFTNRLLGTEINLRNVDALECLLNNVPEDFAIVVRDPQTGSYCFRAGVICSALGWSLATKLGKELKNIHAEVPDYKEKIEVSMDRFFAKLPTDKPIQRGSWSLETDTPLFAPTLSRTSPSSLANCTLRVDWQTLRRLPLSGAIVFNYKCLFTPLTSLANEPYIPALLAKILEQGKEELMGYKGVDGVKGIVVPALREIERRQKEQGVVEEEWEVGTLGEYPWFPGWEVKWRGEQGF
ncbi:hypothetical protein E4T48_01689 [Aureobasidium sp. EXF-10727]|nr:hypothetical protein E4T48_01689 [Aureobasidium sp. EXF-10727]